MKIKRNIAAVILFSVFTIVLISSCEDSTSPNGNLVFEDPLFELLVRSDVNDLII